MGSRLGIRFFAESRLLPEPRAKDSFLTLVNAIGWQTVRFNFERASLCRFHGRKQVVEGNCAEGGGVV